MTALQSIRLSAAHAYERKTSIATRLRTPTLCICILFCSAAYGALPDGYQQITSTNGLFEYLLPSHWVKDGFNAYRGPDGSAIETVYPKGIISEEYCKSFTLIGNFTGNSSSVYDNGDARGCYAVRRYVNTNLQKEWRHFSFKFPTKAGVECVTIIVPESGLAEARVKTIIDSIRVKP